MAQQGEVQLKVAEAFQDDVNKGIIRIDSTFMQKAGIRPGDIVEIHGERATVAIADRAYPSDIGQDIIRMDGLIRRNAGTSIGELVTVSKAEISPAKKVTIAPAKKGLVVRAAPEIFKHGLLGRAVVRGDIVSLGGSRRRRSTLSSSPFEEIFRMLDEDMTGFGFGDLKFIVADTNPKQPVIITSETEIVFNPEAVEVAEEKTFDISYEDVGGLSDAIRKIREMVELPLKHPEIFEALGIEPPKGILLYGPPGTGKTLLAKAVANETSSHFIVINGPEIMSKYYGQSEQNLRKKFEEAEQNAPSIIFIDEIDAIASKREEAQGEVEKRVVAQMLAIMDGLKSRGKVVVIAATNMQNQLDPALRRPGRFDREIEIGPPSKEGRLDILKIHTRYMPLLGSFYDDVAVDRINQRIEREVRETPALKTQADDAFKLLQQPDVVSDFLFRLQKVDDAQVSAGNESGEVKKAREELRGNELFAALGRVMPEQKVFELGDAIRQDGVNRDLERIAAVTHGFVGADLAALAKEAALIVIRREMPRFNIQEDEPIPHEVLESLKIRYRDFVDALKIVRPSAMREVMISVPTTKWHDVAALDDARQSLSEAVEWPLKYPRAFEGMGIEPPKGILLYGPSGTGKTLLAKAVANEAEANFISVKGPELLSKWVGESEKAVRQVFDKARQNAPTIIFFDEFDSLAPRRGMGGDSNVAERVVNQLLTELDGLEKMTNVVVIAASNRPDMIDPSLLRPGRFDRLIHIRVPDETGRKAILDVHTRRTPLELDGLDRDEFLERLSSRTEGYTGADLENLVREAAMTSLKRNEDQLKSDSPTRLAVSMADFERALDTVKPSVTKETLDQYEQIEKTIREAQDVRGSQANYFG